VIRKLVAGNWKSNGSRAANSELLAALLEHGQPDVDLAVFVPAVYAAEVVRGMAGSAVAVGAQDLSEFGPGAYTGETTGQMIADVGCSMVIVGHSERRALFGESDACVARKARQALEAGLVPVVCVGETLDERDSGLSDAVVVRQLDAVAEVVGADGLARLVIAYEPVWAIGTGRSATVEQIETMHSRVRDWLPASAGSVRVLYGGSVKSGNAAAVFGCRNVDGVLVGGASLIASEFLAIATEAYSSR
jgi:triosephosphate isomerase